MQGISAKREDFVWGSLLLVILAAFGFLNLDSQPYLSFDDHGKDLYAFEMFLEGQWPCRDYWWQYGPLMLFYYAFWLLVGGIHFISIRLGVALLYIVSAFVAFRALRLITSAPIAFLGALAYLIQWIVYPYYNYNHLGTVPFLLFAFYSLWKFFLTRKLRWVYIGTLALAGLALVKINIGVTSFAAFYASLFFCQVLARYQKVPSTPMGWKHFFFSARSIRCCCGVTVSYYVFGLSAYLRGSVPWGQKDL